jgi:two-component system, chemotaxis family, chemotaxis protein CheY
VPIIVLTTRGDDVSRSAAMQAGATVYLTKPFRPDVLGGEARKLLGADDDMTIGAR